ncbi:TetR family transcriptional regulator [Arthrobacter sp. MYb227]|uniref:TetR/AcrR family transcriptional regulator n=1 Tax=Arthrobacter sp. MYb227 TaxID=1848601 RepID=UPI000CFDD6FB|nr:TetR family transcriptional regulator [Arthrobacter sp. MYb227]PQZ87770.1 TetR family transcriptional regulator [Arthrobacter sp. MYb227]
MITSSAVPDAALRLLVEKGFDATSVDALAQAAGISRSTFFRRFGSKEEMVFADQEMIIHHLETMLATSSVGPVQSMVNAGLVVFDQHTARPEAASLRHQLLLDVPSLRDRELVSIHRYERVFRNHLRDRGLYDLVHGRAMCIAFASGVVSVHNDHLRRWLRHPEETRRPELERELLALGTLFTPVLEPTDEPARVQPTTVVITISGDAPDTEAVVDQVRNALNGTH